MTSCQAASLRQLEEENHDAAARLEEVVYRGDMLLEKIQSALADIAQSQLRTRNGAPSQPSPAESWPATYITLWTIFSHFSHISACFFFFHPQTISWKPQNRNVLSLFLKEIWGAIQSAKLCCSATVIKDASWKRVHDRHIHSFVCEDVSAEEYYHRGFLWSNMWMLPLFFVYVYAVYWLSLFL